MITMIGVRGSLTTAFKDLLEPIDHPASSALCGPELLVRQDAHRLERACERAGIKDLDIHALRGRAGMDTRETCSLEAANDPLDHKSIRMPEAFVNGKARPSR